MSRRRGVYHHVPSPVPRIVVLRRKPEKDGTSDGKQLPSVGTGRQNA